MKERPILFSGPMVRALLDGSKTQTRRILSPRPHEIWKLQAVGVLACPGHFAHAEMAAIFNSGDNFTHAWKCPYGQPGDRLWVRERWAEVGTCDPGLIIYHADYPDCVPPQYENVPPISKIKWKPSIHMFRKDSRIMLEITGIRVERLQDISDTDCMAEGITDMSFPMRPGLSVPRHNYADLWESIHGPDSWDTNPWVWVIEFKRVIT